MHMEFEIFADDLFVAIQLIRQLTTQILSGLLDVCIVFIINVSLLCPAQRFHHNRVGTEQSRLLQCSATRL